MKKSFSSSPVSFHSWFDISSAVYQRRGVLFALLLACIIMLIVAGISLQGCSRSEPYKIGFVGGLTGRVADLGISGRDGAILAVEEINIKGGVRGRSVQLIIKDDKQSVEDARRADTEFIGEGVVAIIGHMTSAMSIATVDIPNTHRILMMSPTTSTNELNGIDDYFYRVYPSSSDAAEKLAIQAFDTMGYKTVSVLYDIRNKAHTEGWYLHFKTGFESRGGRVLQVSTYTSGPKADYLAIAEAVHSVPADCYFIIANALDTAMLCQQLFKTGRKNIITSEWAATEELIRYGGKSVEGVKFLQTFDASNTSPKYVKFRKVFKERFKYEPGFASAHAYDCANIIMDALQINPEPKLLKETIKAAGSFEGVQGRIRFVSSGDVERTYIPMKIENGMFKRL